MYLYFCVNISHLWTRSRDIYKIHFDVLLLHVAPLIEDDNINSYMRIFFTSSMNITVLVILILMSCCHTSLLFLFNL
jgi:hypothetical protein